MEWLTWRAIGIILGTLVLFLVFQEGLPALVRHWQRIGGSSTVSHPRQTPAAAPRSTPAPIPLRRAAIRQAEHRYRMERLSHAREVRKREAEVRLRSAEVRAERDIKERQDEALRRYATLPKVQKGRSKVVEIPDSLLVDLMGINEKDFYARLKEYRAEHLELERVRALPPTPPELAKMEPMPS